MLNKKIHEDALKRRSSIAEPDVQKALCQSILAYFGPRLTRLDNHAWEYGLTFGLEAKGALEVFRELRDRPEFAFNMLIDVTAVDWLDRREQRFEVIYQLLSLTHLHRLALKIQVSEESPEVESLLPLWPAANFLEREVWDMYGIRFRGHSDLRRILMYDEFVGYPLRKDYPIRGKQPRVQLRVPELRNTADDMHRHELVSLPVRQKLRVQE